MQNAVFWNGFDLNWNENKGKQKNQISYAAKKKVHVKQFLPESNILVNSEVYAQFQNNSLNFFTTSQISFNFFFCFKTKKINQHPPYIIAVVVMVIPSGCISEYRNGKK